MAPNTGINFCHGNEHVKLAHDLCTNKTLLLQAILVLKYIRLPIIRTFKGNRKKFELSGGRVVEGKLYRERPKGK